MNFKTKAAAVLKRLLCLLGCAAVSFVLYFVVFDNAADISDKKLEVSDFELNDCEPEPDGITLISRGNDPQMVIRFSKPVRATELSLRFKAAPESFKLQVFYLEDGEFFTEECSYVGSAGGPGEYSVSINKKIYALRIDPGCEAGQVFRIDGITLSFKDAEYISESGIDYYWLRPLRKAQSKDWAVFVLLTAGLCAFGLVMTKKEDRPAAKYLPGFMFCAVLMTFFLKTGFTGVEFSKEGFEDNESMETVISGIEDGCNDKTQSYRTVVDTNAFVAQRLLGVANREGVTKGKDGWLFYNGENNLDIAYGTFPMTEGDYESLAKLISETDREFRKQDIDFVFVGACSKVSIYPEYLCGDCEVTGTPSGMLRDALEKERGVRYIYLKDALLSEKQNRQLYYMTDTHWNDSGIYTGYRVIYDELSKEGLLSGECPRVRYSQGEWFGDINRMTGSRYALRAEKTEVAKIRGRKSERVESGDSFNRLYSVARDYDIGEIVYCTNDSVEGKRILVFGSSFSMTGNTTLADYLAENCSEVLAMKSSLLIPELIELFEPDVVIYEKGERGLQNSHYYLSSFLAYCGSSAKGGE